MKKSLIFKILYLFLVLIVVAGASVFATNTYLASQVSYGNSNVEDALNGLFALKENTYNYSTDEQIIGKWINEKPIYRKVISQNSYNDIDLSQLHIDSVIDINAGGYGNNGSYRKINFNAGSSSYYDSWHSGIFYENNKIKFEVGSSFKDYLPQVIVFIQYTKTTD